MNEQLRTHLLSELVNLVQNATEDLHPSDRPFLTFDPGMPEPVLTLTGDLVTQFNSIVARILGVQNWSERFSEDFISGKLGTLLLALRIQGIESAPMIFDDLLAYLASYSVEWTVLVPVIGS